jgi:hypothetical protein
MQKTKKTDQNLACPTLPILSLSDDCSMNIEVKQCLIFILAFFSIAKLDSVMASNRLLWQIET